MTKTAAKLSALAGLLLTLSATLSWAQQDLGLPQATPNPPLTHQRSNNVQTIPTLPAPQSEPPPARPEAEIPTIPAPQVLLPAIFHGCWRGRVDYVDQLLQLPGGAPTGQWIPKTYLLCYRQVGNGPFKLTFTNAGMEGSQRIINPSGHMKLLESDGRRYARMQAGLDFDEYRAPPGVFGRSTLGGLSGLGGALGLFGGRSTFNVHEVTTLTCRIEPDGMLVTGDVYGTRDGVPWFRAVWHTTFFRTPS